MNILWQALFGVAIGFIFIIPYTTYCIGYVKGHQAGLDYSLKKVEEMFNDYSRG